MGKPKSEKPNESFDGLNALEARVAYLERRLQVTEDKRKMQAMLVSLNEVLLDMGGPVFLGPQEAMPSCLICNEVIKPGEWLYHMDTRSVLDMTPIIENVDGRADEDFDFGLKIRYVHRQCFLEAIIDNNIDSAEDEASVVERLMDPRYKEPFHFDEKIK